MESKTAKKKKLEAEQLEMLERNRNRAKSPVLVAPSAKDKRLANLVQPWGKGQSGNPNGRPVMKPITEAVNNILSQVVPDSVLMEWRLEKFVGLGWTFGDLAAFRQIQITCENDPKNKQAATTAYKELANRIEGKVALEIRTNSQISIEHSLSDEDRKLRIMQLLQQQNGGNDALPYIDAEVLELPEHTQTDTQTDPE